MPRVSAIQLRARDGSVRAIALVDEEDFERFGSLRWCLHYGRRGPEHGYAARLAVIGRRRVHVFLHREILGLPIGDPREGDHRNGNRLDCRRGNLRVVPAGANQQNRPAWRRARSRFRGVSFASREGKWIAQVKANGRNVLFAYCENELQAAVRAQSARDEYLPFAEPDPALVEALAA